MKQDEEKKQPWEPMQLTCVGRIGEVVEAGRVKEDLGPEVQTATPPDDTDLAG